MSIPLFRPILAESPVQDRDKASPVRDQDQLTPVRYQHQVSMVQDQDHVSQDQVIHSPDLFLPAEE